LDFDSTPESAYRLANKLEAEDISFDVYTSGNRSIHLHVAIEPMEGTTVAQAQKQWVKQHAPDADLTIYHNTALYRLTGTWHEKNPGHRKQLLDRHQGNYKLVIDPWTRKPPTTVKEIQEKVSPHILALALGDKVSVGGRRCHVWRIGTICYDLGLDYSEAVRHAYNWNNEHAVPPLDSRVIEQKIYEAYEQRSYNA
jgi:hypothetical protein